MLSAAFRNVMHWSEFVGGDVVVSRHSSGPSSSTTRTNGGRAHGYPVRDIMKTLPRIPEFVRAYEPDGMDLGRVRYLRCHRADSARLPVADADLDALVRDVIMPASDSPGGPTMRGNTTGHGILLPSTPRAQKEAKMLNIAVTGAGRIGHVHAKTITAHSRHQFRLPAGILSAMPHASWPEVLVPATRPTLIPSSRGVDAVVIGSPTPLHTSPARCR